MTCKRATLIALPAILLLAGLALWWSPINQDEGWYLMASRRVAEGQAPYLDFAFTQPPVFPAVYRAILPFVHAFGLPAARLFTLGCAIASIALLAQTLKTEVPAYALPLGVLILLLLTGLNPVYLQFSSTVKTYSLAGLFLTGAVCFRLKASRSPTALPLLLCGVCSALAAGTRLSLGFFAVALFVELLLHRREMGSAAAGWFALGGTLTLFAVFAPSLLLAPEQMYFGLWEFHSGRSLDQGVAARGGFLLRGLRNWLPAVIGLCLLWPKRKRLLPLSKAFLGGVLLVTIVHFLAPFPYDEYQTMLLPVVALVIALEAPRALPGNLRRKAPGWILLSCGLFAVTSPALESWFGATRDRIWWPAKQDSDLWRLKEAAAVLELHDPDGTLLLTMDTFLAVETGRDVPRGLEMGPFSYFPGLSTSRAERLHVLNRERAEQLLLETQATAAAVSGYTFAIQGPALTPTPQEDLDFFMSLLREKYRYVESRSVGQGNTTLKMHTLH